MSGSASDDVWAVGEEIVLHWDGVSWQTHASDVGIPLWDVWAGASNDVVVVGGSVGGYDGTVLRWNGATWEEEVVPNVPTLVAVWGSGADDIWAVGDHGTSLHWDGAAWTVPAEGPNATMNRDVWGSGPTDVWVAGTRGEVFHWDGFNWVASTTPTVLPLNGIAGNNAGVWAVGSNGTILRHP